VDNLILIYKFTDRGGKLVYSAYDFSAYTDYVGATFSGAEAEPPPPIAELRLAPENFTDHDSCLPTGK
jgi:hypothetical protein